MPAPTLEEWIALVERFADSSLPGEEFDDAYFALHHRADEASDRGELWVREASPRQVDEARWILNDFFVNVDRFANSPDMPAEIPVSEEELRAAARRVVWDLRNVASGMTPHPSRSASALRLALVSIRLALQAALFAIYGLWRVMRWPIDWIASNRRAS